MSKRQYEISFAIPGDAFATYNVLAESFKAAAEQGLDAEGIKERFDEAGWLVCPCRVVRTVDGEQRYFWVTQSRATKEGVAREGTTLEPEAPEQPLHELAPEPTPEPTPSGRLPTGYLVVFGDDLPSGHDMRCVFRLRDEPDEEKAIAKARVGAIRIKGKGFLEKFAADGHAFKVEPIYDADAPATEPEPEREEYLYQCVIYLGTEQISGEGRGTDAEDAAAGFLRDYARDVVAKIGVENKSIPVLATREGESPWMGPVPLPFESIMRAEEMDSGTLAAVKKRFGISSPEAPPAFGVGPGFETKHTTEAPVVD